jgi:hypothetical protein
MFGGGKRKKVKKSAAKFVNAIIDESEKSFRPFLQIILQSLMDAGVKPERVQVIVNCASPTLVYLVALFTYEIIKYRVETDNGTDVFEVADESINAMRRQLTSTAGEYVALNTLNMIDTIFSPLAGKEVCEEELQGLVGLNALYLFDINLNPELKHLIENSECVNKLEACLEKSCVSWWKTERNISAK